MKTKTIILAVAIILIIGVIYYFENSKVRPGDVGEEDVEKENPASLDEEFVPSYKDKLYQRAPELTGIAGYINSEEGIKISDFRGKVILIDFWTYSCINCIRTLPYLTNWDEKYRDKGLVIIGVHTPEFEFEKDYENVKDAVEKYGIKYRVAQDNDYKTWRAFNNRFWPRKYLIDADGYIRYDHIGEGAYEETELKIQELLAEIGEDASDIETVEEGTRERLKITPELYTGYDFALTRGQNIGNLGGLKSGEVFDYVLSRELEKDKIYLEGKWKSKSDDIEFYGEENDIGSVVLNFTAREVNVVADSLNSQTEEAKAERLYEPRRVEVFINGNYIGEEQAGKDVRFSEGKSFLEIDKAQLYNVVNNEYGNYILELRFLDRGVSLNAFTFG